MKALWFVCRSPAGGRFYQFLCSHPDTYSYTSSITAPPAHREDHHSQADQRRLMLTGKFTEWLDEKR